jgi:serine kinase of HPr protein (carbohydrate metabolism regulator)
MSETVHATVVLAGAHGILIRGPSGSGKSTLAAALIRDGARLVADDSVQLSAMGGRIVATQIGPHGGRMEVCGRGIVDASAERSAVIRLVADLVDGASLARMPEEPELHTEILGVRLPRQPIPARSAVSAALLDAALSALHLDWKRGLRSA